MKSNWLFGIILFIFLSIFSITPVFATDLTDIGNLVDDFKFETDTSSSMSKTDMKLSKTAKTEQQFWNEIYTEYKGVIIGISGLALLTFTIMFICSFTRLGTTANNPQAKKGAQIALRIRLPLPRLLLPDTSQYP